jgi:Coatomer (COPI) alpha subunit C-terminus
LQYRQQEPHAAAIGALTAHTLLSRQIAAVNFAPLQANVMALVQGATSSLPGLTQLPSLKSSLQRNGNAPEKVSRIAVQQCLYRL